MRITKHPLIKVLTNLKGNPRACVYTEPLWGIPYNLYAPFVTVYMYKLGLNDVNIGLILSVSLLVQLLSALFSGIITDKQGRRYTTFIYDFVSWSLPCIIWALSQNFWFFLVAAICNGTWQITSTSWNCLLVEDADKSQLVSIFTWIYISGMLAVFFAPLSGLLVAKLTVVPAMRILYVFSFISMSIKFVVLYIYSTETKQGAKRMKESKGVPVSEMLREYRKIIPMFLKSREMVTILIISVMLNITASVSTNFYGLLVTQTLNISEQYLAYFPILRAFIMMTFMFIIQHRLERLPFRIPMIVGVFIYIASQLSLIFATSGGFASIILYVICEAFACAIVMPRRDTMAALFITPEERARIMSLMNVVVLGFSMPFGYIAGLLSNTDRRLPFIMNILLFCTIIFILFGSKRLFDKKTADTIS